ncbi:hypothetical protein [Microbulbifer spongiae]|uniref:Uncharacterized protein n=1 Tax=Microbulbifer spongiae TaxID=2944933 RepID=A0ABY9EAC1_9GAMM|nr:hypothetical protein [Microbulbifer sp. MI-G]WKD49102.1 hypothetical protein M8T91_14545 [Microbulbifer sp. MI-G]
MKDIKRIEFDLPKLTPSENVKLQAAHVALTSLIFKLCKIETLTQENIDESISLAMSRVDEHKHDKQVQRYLEAIDAFLSPAEVAPQKAPKGEVINFPSPASKNP